MTAIADTRHDRAYPKTGVCAFRFTRAEWGLFSNFAPLPVPIAAGDWFFPTSEHLYQAAKFPARPDLQALIAAQPTPALAARIGRTAAPLTPTWHTDRVAVMRWVIRRKREAIPQRFDALFRRTAGRPIVEFSARDTYWGPAPTPPTTSAPTSSGACGWSCATTPPWTIRACPPARTATPIASAPSPVEPTRACLSRGRAVRRQGRLE
ncbi:MAG: NADAR family protein [Gammaproteobacteria bacterium]|nr:NADAR family protein [Gammaproteobacteria bacterium]